MESLKWDAADQSYIIELEDQVTKHTSVVQAQIVFSAVGALTHPFFPKDLVGVDKFRGPAWHSARWRHDIDLSGKRVGVIGNGCSA